MPRQPTSRPLHVEGLESRLMPATGVLSGSSTVDAAIPDNGGFSNKAISTIALSGAPAGAIVTGVDVEYWANHPQGTDLRIYATTQRGSTWYDHLYLWDRAAGAGGVHGTVTGLTDWNGLSPGGTWYLVAGDFAAGNAGLVDGWNITVHWATVDPVPPLTQGRLAWHAYTNYDARDGQIFVYDFAAGAVYPRANATISAAVTHAHNPVFCGDGRYLAFMGLPAGPAYGANWRQYLDVFVYDFTTDRVTNLSATLGLSQAGQIEEDPAISPDATKVVFKRNTADVWEASLFGGGLRRVTTGAGEKSGPQYSPDGSTIVFWVGGGSTAFLATAPANAPAPVAPTPLHDNPGVQDYFPSYWDADRVLYTSWRAGGAQDDDVKVWDAATGTDAFAAFNLPTAEDSDPFRITATLIGYSTTRGGTTWQLWYGDPVTGAAAALNFGVANKHNLGAKYTTAVVNYAPPSADFNSDARVDGIDFLAWQRGFGLAAPTAASDDGDADHDRDVDADDLTTWNSQFGTVAPAVSASLAAAPPNEAAVDGAFAALGGGVSTRTIAPIDGLRFNAADDLREDAPLRDLLWSRGWRSLRRLQ